MDRLTFILASLMIIPAVIVGGIVFATAERGNILSYWITLLLIVIVLIGCVVVAFVFSHNIADQLTLLTNAARAINFGRIVHHLHPRRLYREFHPLYEYMKSHMDFHNELTENLSNILRDQEEEVLELRSEDDEFMLLIRRLVSRLKNLCYMSKVVAEGNLASLTPIDESSIGPEKHLQTMIAELSGLITKARNYTNQMVRAGSQINSVTTQSLQDTKIVTKRIDDISQSIHHMATTIQHVAEHVQEQSSLLGDSSSSVEHTMRSVEEIADNITYLKTIVEKSTLSSQASEETTSSLDLMYNATKAIEKDANTCVACSQEAAEDAEHGKIAVQQTIEGINRIQESMDELFEIVRRLSDRAEEVSETLDAISDIADHTNLLAINAAIISAHAGEHGRDFAVIADEIGKFVERTRESTGEIEELLKTIQAEFSHALRAVEKSSKAVSNGVELSHRAGKTLGKIASSIFNTKEMVTRIAAATADQSRENEHIRQIMGELVQLQKERQEQANSILWQLMQAIAQIRGITSEQAEGSAKMAATAQSLERITQEISRATSQHVTTANQIVDDVNYIRKLLQRTTFGTEKTTQLTNELFTLGGNLALTMGDFVLSNRILPPDGIIDTQSIGFIKRGADSFFDYMAAGIQTEAEQYGFHLLEISSQYEVTTQVEDVNWLLKHPSLKGIIICPVDISVAQKLVRKGVEQGVPCIAADESITTTISVRSGNREGGRRAGELFAEHLRQHAVIGVGVDRTVESTIRRLEGFKQHAQHYPFEIVEIYCDIPDPEKERDYIVFGIQDNPGLEGFFLTNETTTIAYLDALHNGLLPSNDLLAVGYDYTPMTEEAIRKGELLGAIFQDPEEIGKQAFQYLYKLIKKEIRVEDVDERTIYIPTVKATKETLSASQ